MAPNESLSLRKPVAPVPMGKSRIFGACLTSPWSFVFSVGMGRLPFCFGINWVFRLVELALDPGPDVARMLDLRQPLVEHEFGDAGRRRDFRFQDVGLAREQHALLAQDRPDLVGARLGRDDEALVGDPPGPR